MSIFKSGNPTLSENKFRSTQLPTDITDLNAMTRQGTLQKFGFMLLLLMGSALYSWKEFNDSAGTSSLLMPMILIGALGGLVIALILMFKQTWAPYLAPVYALLEGLFIGAISAQYDYVFPGLVANAVGLTFGVGIAMYFLYQFGIIKATERFKSIVFTATAGLAIFYLAVWVLNMFGIHQLQFIHEGGTFGILFSVFVVALATLNLILDFDMIDQGVAMGAPKYMEWYGAFGLMVTFVWLYLEILRLLSKLSSRD
jgi:uncharacterized YccA/Bax inhibitor family protein